jgi:hypothetical protein
MTDRRREGSRGTVAVNMSHAIDSDYGYDGQEKETYVIVGQTDSRGGS